LELIKVPFIGYNKGNEMTLQTALMNPKTMMIAASAGMLALGTEAIVVPKFMDSAYERYIVEFPLKATPGPMLNAPESAVRSRKFGGKGSKSPVS
jgi:hypothetical protein